MHWLLFNLSRLFEHMSCPIFRKLSFIFVDFVFIPISLLFYRKSRSRNFTMLFFGYLRRNSNKCENMKLRSSHISRFDPDFFSYLGLGVRGGFSAVKSSFLTWSLFDDFFGVWCFVWALSSWNGPLAFSSKWGSNLAFG